MNQPKFQRRQVLKAAAQLGAFIYVGNGLQSSLQATEAENIQVSHGVASGDVRSDGGILWSRANRPAKMLVEIATDSSFEDATRIQGPTVLPNTDFTGKLRVGKLQPGTQYLYRVRFQSLDGRRRMSEPVTGAFTTSPADRRDVSFLWSGDTAGQGFGIDEARGGMATYETMHQQDADFFVHSGDTCYSDNPFPERIELDDGSTWNNLVLPETSKVAETIDEFRANQRYNLLDKNVRDFNAQTPIFAQWDDHETANNWYPGETLSDDRYQVRDASLLAARAKQAFFEYLPIRTPADKALRVHRVVPYGPLLDLFFLDLRSFRGPNTKNNQSEQSAQTRYLGMGQLQWLKRQLLRSQATWKVICSDMPIGMIVSDGEHFENGANGNGPPLGRELEIAELLKFVKQNSIHNTVWITADVHYAASHFYDPNQAVFQEFDPFWEFVSGPLHAGTFGPSKMDNTFGPQVRFNSIPDDLRPNRPPSEGLQFFGKIAIDAATQTMTVSHFNRAGKSLWSVDLDAQA